MLKKLIKLILYGIIGVVVLVVGFVILVITLDDNVSISTEPVIPDWTAITAWPGMIADAVEARPDPNRTFTAIVLDDSGSMGADIIPAREAVVAALSAMDDSDRVAVFALNRGVILRFTDVAEARGMLPNLLATVISDGSTPLTEAIQASRAALAEEAAVAGGFGTYRILVTTDGAADNGGALTLEVEDIARVTPIQVATIGVGIGGRHVLRREDLAAFVAIDNVAELESALRSAIAEEQTFSAITEFGAGQ
ncbi:MAG: vWA domain-containing protein [Pseudomonadota bacterium]